MPITQASFAAKKRILAVCAGLFIEKGYKGTTVAEILQNADVSASTFQNIFGAKDGVLTEFVKAMFGNQFAVARMRTDSGLPAMYTYAMETSIQLALTEQNENLRGLYVEAYTVSESIEFIHRNTAPELMKAFSAYCPGCVESDFYEMDIASAGMMRSFMVRRCDMYFDLEQKIRRFLTMSLSAYHVPMEEQRQVLNYVLSQNIREMAMESMQELFDALSMHFTLPV